MGEPGCTSAPPWPYQLQACLLTCGRLEHRGVKWGAGGRDGEKGGQRALRKRWLCGPPTQLGARYSPQNWGKWLRTFLLFFFFSFLFLLILL